MVVLQPVVGGGDDDAPGGVVYQEVEQADGGDQPEEGRGEGEEEEETSLARSSPLTDHQGEGVQRLLSHSSVSGLTG